MARHGRRDGQGLQYADYGPIDIDAYLDELDLSEAVRKPIWAVARTSTDNIEVLERVLAVLEENGVHAERSYDTKA